MSLNRQTALAVFLFTLAPLASGTQPVDSSWIVNPAASRSVSDGLARSLPEVHTVERSGNAVIVRSAGISVHNLAPFQTPPTPVERLRSFEFRIPAQPRPAADQPLSVRPDVLGVFLNGQPIYNYFDAASYQGQNIWRYDLIARNDDGTITAGGAPRPELDHQLQLGLLKGLLGPSSKHSPILGFAFDGSPVYGPWGYARADGSGGLQRMRSSYRLRTIQARTRWPDGTELTVGQAGPAIGPDYPLGSFVEDYEFVPGAGDLDRLNGRFTVTPEYPNGVYAYFLSVNDDGRLAFPYLIGGEYHGSVTLEELDAAVTDRAAGAPVLLSVPLSSRGTPEQDARLQFRAGPDEIVAGEPAVLSFQAFGESGQALRSLEYVHEKPIHLLVVSEDLSLFDHIHPELRGGGRYVVNHVFPAAGAYRIYADYTPPGQTQHVESFELRVAGDPVPAEPLETAAGETLSAVGPVQVALTAASELATGQDIELVFRVRDAATGKRIPQLTPFLGAWGHFVLIREGHGSFLHAHPYEQGREGTPGALAHSHVHGAGAEALGPPPSEIRILTNFSEPGLYKLWAQFGVEGEVVTAPFVLRVHPSDAPVPVSGPIPAGAKVVRITSNGFEPARITIDPDQPSTLAFARSGEPNCGAKVVFPALGLEQDVPLGGVALVEIPAQAAGELTFSCGMGMYRGAIVVGASSLPLGTEENLDIPTEPLQSR